MPRRSTTRKATKKRSTQRGKGAIGDVARFIKDHKLISKGLSMIPHPAGQAASYVAGLVGLGRKRRTRKKATSRSRVRMVSIPNAVAVRSRKRSKTVRVPQVGRGIFSDLGGGLGSVFGGLGSGVGSVAHGFFGAGRKKGTSRRRNVVAI